MAQTQFPNGLQRRWWTLKPNDAAASISGSLELMAQRHRSRLSQLVTHARLYGNLSIWGLTGFSYQQLRAAVQSASPGRVTYNLCQSCVDTVTSKVAKNKVKPYFLTKHGDFKAQRKAKKLNDYLDGIWYEAQLDDKTIESFRFGAVFGDGLLYIGPRNGRVYVERVPPSQVYVDEWEGMNREPRQMTRVMLIDRSVAMEAFSSYPGAKKALEEATTAKDVSSSYYPTVSDLVEVRESWHLRSGPETKDGKHIITVGGGKPAALTALEDWDNDWFPIVRFSWSPKMLGFWSQGAVEQLEGTQIEINKLLRLCQKSHDLMGSFKFLKHVGSHVVDEHQRSDIGAVVEWAGEVEPKYVLPPHVPPEVYEQIEVLIARGYKVVGVSELSAASEKPAGLDSEPSLRKYADIEADRFRTVERYWQSFILDVGKRCIATAKYIAEENGGHYAVTTPGKKFLRSVDWKDIDLEEDEYIIRAFPVSALPDSPEGRLATVQELAQAAQVPQRHVLKLINFPDLDQFVTLATAAEEWLSEVLDRMVDDGVYTAPDGFDDLSMAMEMALQYYAEGKSNNLAEDRLDLLRRFMSQVQAEMANSAPPAAPPGSPQAVPTPPPQSPLLPNAPPPQQPS